MPLCMLPFFSCLVVFVFPKPPRFSLFYRCIANWLSPFLSPFLFVFVYLFYFFSLICSVCPLTGSGDLGDCILALVTQASIQHLQGLSVCAPQILRYSGQQCGCELAILGHSSGKLSPRCLAGDGGRG